MALIWVGTPDSLRYATALLCSNGISVGVAAEMRDKLQFMIAFVGVLPKMRLRDLLYKI